MSLIQIQQLQAGGAVIARLHEIQKEHKHLCPKSLKLAAEDLGVSLIKLYSAATFYTAFSFKPRGSHTVKVCMGTACHIRGSEKLLDNLETILGVKREETTEDGEFTLESVHCVGSCAMAPVIQIDAETRGRLKANRLAGLLKRYKPDVVKVREVV